MRKKTILLLILAFTATHSFSQDQASKREKRKSQYKVTLNLIESGKFNFEASKAIPQGGGYIHLTSNPNYLKISNGKANAYLPFFGERYLGHSYGEGGTIKFDDPITDYKVKQKEDKLQIEIHFKVNTQKDLFTCYLNVSFRGNTSLSINSNTRSHITYYGDIKSSEE